jgi:hypothetical protein
LTRIVFTNGLKGLKHIPSPLPTHTKWIINSCRKKRAEIGLIFKIGPIFPPREEKRAEIAFYFGENLK